MGDAEIVRAHVAMMELGVVSNVFFRPHNFDVRALACAFLRLFTLTPISMSKRLLGFKKAMDD